MIIPLKTFTGEFPRMKPHLLPDFAAQSAVDCDFVDGSLRGCRTDDLVAGVSGSNIKSLFVYEGGAGAGKTFFWSRDVDAVRSPAVDDHYARFYWADGSSFNVSRGDVGGNGEPSQNNTYKVGVPRPAAALTPTVSFGLHGFTFQSMVLMDERVDGSTANPVDITESPSNSSSGMKWTFSARAPSVTQKDDAPAPVTGQISDGGWSYNAVMSGVVGNEGYSIYTKPFSQSPAVYCKTTADSIVVYSLNNDPHIVQQGEFHTSQYQQIVGWEPFTRISGTDWFLRIGNDYPSNITNPVLPQKVNKASSDADFAGAMVKLTFARKDGAGVESVIIRGNGRPNTIPSTFSDYRGSLVNDGTNYTVDFTCDVSNTETRAYTYTYVNQYGEEGAPADPSVVECGSGDTVTLSVTQPPSGFCPITRIRIYRTATGGGASYLYVGQLNAGQGSFDDSVPSESLGAALNTTAYYPPQQNLVGITQMSNGILVGFVGNELHFSEPYLAYAWNPAAIKPFPNRIVGICPFEGGLYVTTTADPYIVQGAAPEFMTDMRVPVSQAGVSKRAIVNYNGAAVYASHDGLVMLQGTQASLDMSFKFFTREMWRSRYGTKLNQMRLHVHDGSLLASFDDGTPGFLVRVDEEAVSLTKLTTGYRAIYRDPVADALYVSTDGVSIKSFRAGASSKPFVWHSKDFIAPTPVSFAAIQLIGSGSITVKVFADGIERFSAAVTVGNNGMTLLRLPSGFLCRRWSVKFEGSGNVDEAYLTTSAMELRNV